jgi:hypothetical protein
MLMALAMVCPSASALGATVGADFRGGDTAYLTLVAGADRPETLYVGFIASHTAVGVWQESNGCTGLQTMAVNCAGGPGVEPADLRIASVPDPGLPPEVWSALVEASYLGEEAFDRTSDAGNLVLDTVSEIIDGLL